MTGNVRAAASERIPNLSMIRATEGLYHAESPVAARGKEMQEFPTVTLSLYIQS